MLVEGCRLAPELPTFNLQLATSVLTRPAAASEAGKHDVAHGAFEQPMGVSQGVIQAGAFLQLGFVQRLLVNQDLGGLAARGAHGINFVRDPGGASYRECGVAFRHSQAPRWPTAQAANIGERPIFRSVFV